MPAYAPVRLAAARIALASALVWTASLRAQAQSPQANATVTLVDGTRVSGRVSGYAPGQRLQLEFDGVFLTYEAFEIRDVVFASGEITLSPPPVAVPPISAADAALRAEELTRLTTQRARLLATNRRWQVPVAGLALSIFSIGIGANQFMAGVGLVGGDCPDEECPGEDKEADRRIAAGLGLMFGGIALFGVSLPMLIVRSVRAGRLGGVEKEITRLGGKLTFAPLLAPRAQAGLRARLAF